MSNPRLLERLSMLEAALYSAGRPVGMENLKAVVRTKSDKVMLSMIRELDVRYKSRRSALEVKALPGNRAVMRLKPEFDATVKRFTNRPLLTSGPLRTLSYIAYHQPVEQVKVVEDRGSHIYSHLRRMEEMGLITRERINGRGYVIETTAYFSEYFGFGHDPMKSKIQLRQMFDELKIDKLDNGNIEETTSDVLADAFSDSPLSDSLDGFM
ncbi:SMC-Scp complex subunit ScpB [Candidatus Bathyarchaeota archaeon]|nr:SMC-Scp complex subunit ScpB [Candidatus Bathyarchaeota archaeon]